MRVGPEPDTTGSSHTVPAIDLDGKDKSMRQISHSISTCTHAAERTG